MLQIIFLTCLNFNTGNRPTQFQKMSFWLAVKIFGLVFCFLFGWKFWHCRLVDQVKRKTDLLIGCIKFEAFFSLAE